MKGCLNILILLAVFSCTKEGAGTAYTSIDAGQTQGESIYYTDRIPDDSVLFVAPSTYRQFGFDINRDQISDLTITATPVSYTHLDVYKRQRQRALVGR